MDNKIHYIITYSSFSKGDQTDVNKSRERFPVGKQLICNEPLTIRAERFVVDIQSRLLLFFKTIKYKSCDDDTRAEFNRRFKKR